MRSDRDQTGRTPRRNPSVPVPGMPYRFHTEQQDAPPVPRGRDFEFIESMLPTRDSGPVEDAYNPWEEMGWQGGDTPFPVAKEPEMLQEERYFKPMLDLNRKMPELYNAYDGSDDDGFEQTGPAPQVFTDDAELFREPPPPPVIPEKRKREPWRVAVVLSCIVVLIFCGVEVYRISKDVIDSESKISEYREMYLKENNVDFIRTAHAVALRPAGETYPPTASPVPRQTPTPTPRIAQNDPLVGAFNGVDPNQSVSPDGETPAPRYKLDRYPFNPLLIIRDEIVNLQLTNPDIVGKLVIDGVMDELVVMRNNTYYLNHNAAGDYSGYGAVFVDQNLVFRYPPENIVLYGRTSNQGKTFAPLKNYVEQGIAYAQQHPFITFQSIYEEARYGIVAVIKSSGDPAAADYFNAQVLSFETNDAMLAFVNEAVSKSLYSFNASVQASDRLLTLVTLSDGTDLSRIIIVCRMLREGEAGYIAAETPAP